MMMQGSVGKVLLTFVTAFLGVALMSAGFQGWLFWRFNPLERLLVFASGILLFIPGGEGSSVGLLTDVIGIALAAVVLLANRKKWERGPSFLMPKK